MIIAAIGLAVALQGFVPLLWVLVGNWVLYRIAKGVLDTRAIEINGLLVDKIDQPKRYWRLFWIWTAVLACFVNVWFVNIPFPGTIKLGEAGRFAPFRR